MEEEAQTWAAPRFRRVCVFCGSSTGKKASYQLAAVQLGQQLVERGIGLVYGGGSMGLMGLVSRAVHNGGGHVTGVVPMAVLPSELIGETPGELKAVFGMHQRKAEMARRADAFVALPGGYGTLEELLEVVTWAQLGIHDKPVGLLNVDGYYDSLLAFIDKAVDEGFVARAARHIIVAAPTPGELLAGLEDYVPAHHDASSEKLTWESSVDTTMGKLLEVVTWAQLGIHDKPVGLLNVDGYYDSLLAFIDKAVDEGFVARAARHIIVDAPTPGELLAGLEDYVPAHHNASSAKLTWESSVDTTMVCASPKPDISR